MKTINQLSLLGILLALLVFSGCDSDDPEKENVEEVITEVNLTFTPVGGGDALVFSATDPDGSGPNGMVPEGPIVLNLATTYDLEIEMFNTLESPPEDISEEVAEEDDEHMIFFGWTGTVFTSPANGDISSNRSDVNYQDSDENGNPLGLSTEWATENAKESGTFRVVLKHQPGLKTATSTVNDGTTDLDVTFTLEIE
jgi:hypothetical protein